MDGPIVIAGAGSVGCFVGGLLALGGREVVFLARPRIAAELGAAGLHLSSLEGWEEHLAPADLRIETDPARALATAGLVLVTVKSGQTEEMAGLIAAHASPASPVVSLQNGLDNAATLRALLPGRPVFAGMVSFNILSRGEGRFHRGTSGPLVIEAGAPPLAAPHLDILAHPAMDEVLAGKLVYNLNNALNALSGLTLREQLADRRWRLLLARCQDEALAVFRAQGVNPWSLGGIAIGRFPTILRLPNFLFRLVARRGVTIDATARSSMWEDLEQRRPTEIAHLQGKVVELAARHGLDAPANAAIMAAISAAEVRGEGSPRLDPAALHIANNYRLNVSS